MASEKREGGQVKNGTWLVLTESVMQPNQSWLHTCGALLQQVIRSHPVWDGPGICCGGGEVYGERVPYCPDCETVPGTTGMPIREAARGE